VIEIEELTKACQTLTVSFMFFYGGRQEILAATKSLCQKIKLGELTLEELNETTLENEFWSHDLPHPDLLLRTGGRNRLSNFLLWQIAYTEVVFLDCYWPDMSSEILETHYRNFLKTERTFGC
jgi:undecaprenyl diphosphate synthase